MCQTLAQSDDNVSDVGSRVMIMGQMLAQSDDVLDVGSVMIMCQTLAQSQRLAHYHHS
jgi:hypothetical protein